MKRKLLATVLTLSLALVSITGCSAKSNESNNDVKVDVNADVEESKNETVNTNETLVDSTVEEVVENEENSNVELSLADELKEKIAETGVQFTIGEKVYTLGYDKTKIDEIVADGYADASILDEENFKNIINDNSGRVPVINQTGETIATLIIDNEHNIRAIKDWSEDISIKILSDITMVEWEENFTYSSDNGEERYIFLEINVDENVTVGFKKNDEGNWQMLSVSAK